MAIANISNPATQTTSTTTAGQTSSSSTSNTSTSGSTAKKPAGGSGVAVGGASSASTADLVAEAKQKVTPLVGAQNADEVVNKDGSINYRKLAELVAQQASQSNNITQPVVDLVA